MPDFELLKAYITHYNHFVCQQINEIPPIEHPPKDKELLELYEMLEQGATSYKAKRNSENILFGQLGLGLFALQQGTFTPIHMEEGQTSMVAETIDYFNRFVCAMEKTSSEIRALSEAVQEGDFTLMLSEAEWEGDMLRVVKEINRLILQINAMLSASHTNGVKLSQSVQTLKHSTQSLSSATTQQAAALDETAASLEELGERVEENMHHTVRMSTIANEAKNAVEEGNVLASNTSGVVLEINRATAEMRDALKVIGAIASQTNILSLNAAIEATRAGAAGRGFAVVAVEVRKLAARSAEAAENIRKLSDMVYGRSDEALTISKQMMQGFTTIHTKIIETATIVDQVSQASQEQTIGITQINHIVHELKQVTENNVNTAEDTNSVAQEVSTLATEMLEETTSKKYIS